MIKYFIVGGGGFIGSHLTEAILSQESEVEVLVYDNFSSGRLWHLDNIKNDNRLKMVHADIKEKDTLFRQMRGASVVYHLASNPDISLALTRPDIDFWEGTYLTNNVLEAMRLNNVKKIIYASGSGVYGDAGSVTLGEDYPFKLPVSTYGASKIAGEALICSYCFMFGMEGISLRFANVVGPRQTHGVGYDFIKKLMNDPRALHILGDGRQSKSYIYVGDIISALRTVEKWPNPPYSYYNIATSDCVTVKEIADMASEIMSLKGVKYIYSGQDRGWKGDVPIVKMESEKIRKLGWANKYSSKEAIARSIRPLWEDARLGRL